MLVFVVLIGYGLYDKNKVANEKERQEESQQIAKNYQLRGEVLIINQIWNLAKESGEVKISPFMLDGEGKFIVKDGKPVRGEEIKLEVMPKP